MGWFEDVGCVAANAICGFGVGVLRSGVTAAVGTTVPDFDGLRPSTVAMTGAGRRKDEPAELVEVDPVTELDDDGEDDPFTRGGESVGACWCGVAIAMTGVGEVVEGTCAMTELLFGGGV